MIVQFSIRNPEDLKKGAMLIFNGKNFDKITVEEINQKLVKEVETLKNEVDSLKKSNKMFQENFDKKINSFIKAFVAKESGKK